MNDKTDGNSAKPQPKRPLGWLLTSLTIFLILGIASSLIAWIQFSEPTAQREGATRQTAMLVQVQTVKRDTFIPRIAALGKVQAAQEIILSPRIEGNITDISENFMPGGFVDANELLVTIDPSDYNNIVKQRESELQQAQANLDIELGKRDIALKEYELLNQELNDDDKDLVLREPQLTVARASVLSAEAALNQAKLELGRTSIRAPFHAQILSRNVNVGSHVDAGMQMARLIGVDEYWVIVMIPLAKLKQIDIPKNGDTGATVMVRNRTAWPEGVYREGRIRKLIGALDDQTRLARVVVSIDDPLALNTDAPQLIVGTVVQAEVHGRPLENVFRIDRDFLRQDNTVWVKQDGKLDIRSATVVFEDREYAYLSDGLEDGDQLVISSLATIAQDVPLRLEGTQTNNAGDVQ
ncbi:MAG: efflux transporter periplasmic adaptor subunit [Phycisphaeraceae bacterium]|nr:efflux transporter periplasmic adaptor subunit [Phycisphaeraceae bacterium]